MSERRTQTRYLPLRVRIRPANELSQHGREQSGSVTENPPRSQAGQPGVPDLSHVSVSERYVQQVQELLRLSALLRTNLSLDEVLQQIAASMAACVGLRVIVISILDETAKYLRPVAFAGVSEEDQRMLNTNPFSVEALLRMMSQEFRVSQSYFIPHDRSEIFNETLRTNGNPGRNEDETGVWHPEDMLMVPLYSPREQKILGCLSLDDPESGRTPTLEMIRMIELFANNAAVAIDTMRIFQEREAERISLEESIMALCEELEQVCRGDLRVRIHSNYQKLQPVADALNRAVDVASGIYKIYRL